MRKVFEEIMGAENVLINEPMSRHTTFKIGGAADFFLMPKNNKQLKDAYIAAKQAGLSVLILGNGSNLLVSDKGIRGVVICLFKKMDSIKVEGEKIIAECGAPLSRVSSVALKAELGGFEFASGIPGTVGGGVYMNAGAYGFELKDIIESVTYMDNKGEICELDGDKCEFGYRQSIFDKNDYTILSCTFRLKRDNKDAIRERINDYTQRRNSKQPIDKPSAGSVFKRPEGYFAGALIEKANLKGVSVGGAQISEKHAGFIINTGNATARDVLDLIEHIKATVLKNDGVSLQPEIKMVGEF